MTSKPSNYVQVGHYILQDERITGIKPASFGLFMHSLLEISAGLTDGYVPYDIVKRHGGTQKQAQALFDCGLWEHGTNERGNKAIYVPDWFRRKTLRSEVFEYREQDARRKASERAAKAGQKQSESESDSDHFQSKSDSLSSQKQSKSEPKTNHFQPAKPALNRQNAEKSGRTIYITREIDKEIDSNAPQHSPEATDIKTEADEEKEVQDWKNPIEACSLCDDLGRRLDMPSHVRFDRAMCHHNKEQSA